MPKKQPFFDSTNTNTCITIVSTVLSLCPIVRDEVAASVKSNPALFDMSGFDWSFTTIFFIPALFFFLRERKSRSVSGQTVEIHGGTQTIIYGQPPSSEPGKTSLSALLPGLILCDVRRI